MSRFEALWICYLTEQMTFIELCYHREKDEMFNKWVSRKIKEMRENA